MNENQPTTTHPEGSDELYRDARNHSPNLVWNYAIKGLLRRGETSVLFGPSNCGKSALVCYIGSRIATGLPVFGSKVRQGIVVHVGAEAPTSILDRIHAYTLPDAPTAAPYIVRMKPVNLSDSSEVDRFIAELSDIRRHYDQDIILTVFDTLARSIGTVDENCAASMTAVASAAERVAMALKSHVMLVHHTGKDVERGGRGSSALRGAVDSEISLTPLKTGEIRVTQEKQRTMPKADDRYFETKSFVLGLDEDGEDRTTVTAIESQQPSEASEKADKAASTSRYNSAVLTALHIRRLTGTVGAKPFSPREILESLPPELFGPMSDEGRMATIRRLLGRFSEQKPAVVEKVGHEWRITGAAAPGSSGP